MIIKVDGIENKELGNKEKLLKFLKENTHSGKVSPQVEVFKSIDVQKDTFHWVMSTFDVDRDFEKVDPAGWNLKNYLANPVILWSHDYSIPAIGYAQNVKAESVLAQSYAFLLCTAVNSDIRTKLSYNQRGINDAASYMLDELTARGWNISKGVINNRK